MVRNTPKEAASTREGKKAHKRMTRRREGDGEGQTRPDEGKKQHAQNSRS